MGLDGFHRQQRVWRGCRSGPLSPEHAKGKKMQPFISNLGFVGTLFVDSEMRRIYLQVSAVAMELWTGRWWKGGVECASRIF